MNIAKAVKTLLIGTVIGMGLGVCFSVFLFPKGGWAGDGLMVVLVIGGTMSLSFDASCVWIAVHSFRPKTQTLTASVVTDNKAKLLWSTLALVETVAAITLAYPALLNALKVTRTPSAVLSPNRYYFLGMLSGDFFRVAPACALLLHAILIVRRIVGSSAVHASPPRTLS